MDEQFNNLVTVLVTATYLEGLLYIGVQFVGVDVKNGQRKMMLGELISEAERHGLVNTALATLLKKFNRFRVGFAHNPDYALTRQAAEQIYSVLPQEEKANLQPAFNNIYPEPTTSVIIALTFERIVNLTYASITEAHARWQSKT